MKKSKLDLEFGDLPQDVRRDYQWSEVAETLKSRPGEWALVHRDLPSSVPWSVNAGRVKAVHPDRGFRTRTVGNDYKSTPRTCSEMWMSYSPELDMTKKRKKAKA